MIDEVINYKIFNTIKLSKNYGNSHYKIESKDIHIIFRFDLVIPVIQTYTSNRHLKSTELITLNLELYKKDHNPARLKNFYNAEVVLNNYNSVFGEYLNKLKLKIKYKDILKRLDKNNNITEVINEIVIIEFESSINTILTKLTHEHLSSIKTSHINNLIYDRFYYILKNKLDDIFTDDTNYDYTQSSTSNMSLDQFGFCNILNTSYFTIDITFRFKNDNNNFVLTYILFEINSKSSYKLHIKHSTVESIFNKHYNKKYDSEEFIHDLISFLSSIHSSLIQKYNSNVVILDELKSKLLDIESKKIDIRLKAKSEETEYLNLLNSLKSDYEKKVNDLQFELKQTLESEKIIKQKIRDSLDLIF